MAIVPYLLVHCKKSFAVFPSLDGMSRIKLPLARNNLILWTGVVLYVPYRSLSISKLFCNDGWGGVEGFVMNSEGISGGGGGEEVRYKFITDLSTFLGPNGTCCARCHFRAQKSLNFRTHPFKRPSLWITPPSKSIRPAP
jgi:hypothetical protein